MNKLLLVVAVLLAIQVAQAKVYKWTDENGKVHFSDQKINSAAQTQQVDLGAMPEMRVVSAYTPVTYSESAPSRWLIVQTPDYLQSPSLLTAAKLITFYFGGDCVSPTSLDLLALQQRYPDVVPDAQKIYQRLSELLKRYGYRNLASAKSLPSVDADNHTALQLSLSIEEIKINACAPKLMRATQSASLDNFKAFNFDKSNVWLRVSWRLADEQDKLTLLTAVSEGSAETTPLKSASIQQNWLAAFDQAATNFLANAAFFERVKPPANMAVLNDKLPPADEIEAPEPTLNALPDQLQDLALKRSKIANALGLTMPIKTMATSYYAENGTWPTSFSQINLNANQLREPGLIDRVELRLGGVIQVYLAASEFGPDSFFQFVPRTAMSNTSMMWDCRTNLEEPLWVGTCKGK